MDLCAWKLLRSNDLRGAFRALIDDWFVGLSVDGLRPASGREMLPGQAVNRKQITVNHVLDSRSEGAL